MGFNVKLVAVSGISPDDIHSRFALRPTSITESDPDSPVVAASLPSGWYLLYFNDRDPPPEPELAVLSNVADVMLNEICESVTTCFAAYWQNGTQKWRVSHDSQRGPDDLAAIGDLPSCYSAVSQRLKTLQSTKGDADYLFDVPVEIFRDITGFRYDGNPDGYPVDYFAVLKRETPPRKWWQLW